MMWLSSWSVLVPVIRYWIQTLVPDAVCNDLVLVVSAWIGESLYNLSPVSEKYSQKSQG